MTKAPHLLMDSRAGYKYGDVTVLDHMAYDGLHDVFTDQPMGALTEQRNDVDKFTRAEQDEYAAQSHQKAAAAWKDGVFADEVVPVSIPQRKGDPLQFSEDEGIGPIRPPIRWAVSSRRFARTAPSPRARPRRSRTAPARSW
ncbi:hypothetical protein NIIDMKKI_18600 [Mycobacterium kansasii]|uniref:acetyl-CoA C-acetyltransferase n=1 Tax=Mycobacterium kansasii TaxID=1768 RepID=A0A7G1I898_MYCKA|nr:hypothetical protein NIIDMKKI_18600 [Mycobacterium kansasii]